MDDKVVHLPQRKEPRKVVVLTPEKFKAHQKRKKTFSSDVTLYVFKTEMARGVLCKPSWRGHVRTMWRDAPEFSVDATRVIAEFGEVFFRKVMEKGGINLTFQQIARISPVVLS